MKIGKLPNSLLDKLIISSIETRRPETVLPPSIGEDCCALDLGGDLCVVSSDPITAADENAGILSVHISLNDLASSGAEPVGILTTVLLPQGTDENYVSKLFENINKTCKNAGIDVLGGHTEITDSVKKTVIVTTAIGRTSAKNLVRSDGAAAGDAILMTKSAGLEGTAIICADKKHEIRYFLSESEIREGIGYLSEISVVEEGLAAAAIGVNAMHDITEGGVLGAVWEICRASGKGARIIGRKIPVRDITAKICRHFDIDVMKLISSGSLLIVCSIEKKHRIVEELDKIGVACIHIGDMVDQEGLYLDNSLIHEPDSDEIYKVF